VVIEGKQSKVQFTVKFLFVHLQNYRWVLGGKTPASCSICQWRNGVLDLERPRLPLLAVLAAIKPLLSVTLYLLTVQVVISPLGILLVLMRELI